MSDIDRNLRRPTLAILLAAIAGVALAGCSSIPPISTIGRYRAAPDSEPDVIFPAGSKIRQMISRSPFAQPSGVG